MARSARQLKILEILSAKEIDRQEDLAEELKKLGFKITQATISRDIKELNIVKVAGKINKYKYAVSLNEEQKITNKHINLFRESVLSIQLANNLIVVRTMIGSANTACSSIDKLNLPEILGSIAGDDTILIITKNNQDAERIVGRLNELID